MTQPVRVYCGCFTHGNWRVPSARRRSTAYIFPEFATFRLLLIGNLYRESGVVSGITNRRWTALFPHSVATFRKEGSKEPSKVWPLSSRCQLSKIKSKEFMVREKHTSTIWALAAGHCERKQMVSSSGHHDVQFSTLCRT